MDDPLFDPWSPEAPAPTPARWRALEGPPPTPPSARGDPRNAARPVAPRPSTPVRARLAGTPGYVRTMAMPRLHEIAQQLQLARHDAVAEDLLDAGLPVARLTFKPWRGPWTEKLAPPASALELAVVSVPGDQIAVRIWLDVEAPEPTEEIRVPTAKLGAGWLEGVVVEFVQRALARG